MTKTLTVVTANLNKEVDGDQEYLAWLRDFLKDPPNSIEPAPGTLTPALILVQEGGPDGSGDDANRIIAVRAWVKRLHSWVLGDVGAHRWAERVRFQLSRSWVVVLSVHGLHLRTQGKAAQDAYYAELVKRIRRLNRLGIRWIIGGDFNRDIHEVAAMLGGRAYGKGIVGIIVSPGLRVEKQGLLNIALEERWSDHPAYWVRVRSTWRWLRAHRKEN